jgi:carbon-monoxide dehydrogenase large subunit
MSIMGTRVVRREDPKFLTVGGTYVDDLPHEGAAWVTYVRSTMAHARITGIDVDEARTAPGVIDVILPSEVDLPPMKPFLPHMPRPLLAVDVVRFVGEPVVAIVTEEKYQGADAADLVWVDLEPLPVLVDTEEALASDVLLFPEVGTNVATELQFGADDALFDRCDVVVSQRMVNQRVAPCPLEVRAAAAAWVDGRLVHWASTQGPHGLRGELAKEYGLDEADVRVLSPDVGGGFGAKAEGYAEEVLLGLIARRVGRPVRWVETRTENMLAMGHGRGQVQYVDVGGDANGRIKAFRMRIVQDCGAYPAVGAVLPWLTRMMASGVYDIERVEVNTQSIVTNTTPTAAYRGAGRPEATAAIERAVDLFAAEAGLDPAEVRRKNLIPADRFPFTTPMGVTYDCGAYEAALDLVLQAAGYEELRAEQAARRKGHDPCLLGIGLSVYVEITNPMSSGDFGSVEVTTEGKARIRVGTFSHGQGHATSFAMIVSDRLGIDLDDIEYLQGDTDDTPSGEGTGGSRSLQVAGPAVSEASAEVLVRAKDLAADLLEADPADVVLDQATGRFHVAGSPTVDRTWADVAAAAGPSGIRADVDFKPKGSTFPFGAHLAVVEIDSETGAVRLLRLVAVDDSGRILNPLIAEGQRQGGIAQGVSQALFEEVRYDEDGNPVTSNFADYAIPTAAEFPDFELVPMETPTPLNELGAKGIGESGTIGATPAVQNAVVDALAHLGVRHVDLPLTAERVWRSIQQATAPDV